LVTKEELAMNLGETFLQNDFFDTETINFEQFVIYVQLCRIKKGFEDGNLSTEDRGFDPSNETSEESVIELEEQLKEELQNRVDEIKKLRSEVKQKAELRENWLILSHEVEKLKEQYQDAKNSADEYKKKGQQLEQQLKSSLAAKDREIQGMRQHIAYLEEENKLRTTPPTQLGSEIEKAISDFKLCLQEANQRVTQLEEEIQKKEEIIEQLEIQNKVQDSVRKKTEKILHSELKNYKEQIQEGKFEKKGISNDSIPPEFVKDLQLLQQENNILKQKEQEYSKLLIEERMKTKKSRR